MSNGILSEQAAADEARARAAQQPPTPDPQVRVAAVQAASTLSRENGTVEDLLNDAQTIEEWVTRKEES